LLGGGAAGVKEEDIYVTEIDLADKASGLPPTLFVTSEFDLNNAKTKKLAAQYRDAEREIGTVEYPGALQSHWNDYSMSFSNGWFETYKKAMDAYTTTEAWNGVW